MQLRQALLSSTFLIGLAALAGSGHAADLLRPVPVLAPTPVILPAVSALNGKIDVFGGGFNSDFDNGGLFGIEGAISVPLGTQFGLQVDGRFESLAGDGVGSVAGHLFWRDPKWALVGIYGSWSTGAFDLTSVARVGAEAELYMGQVSFEGLLGWEHDNNDLLADKDRLFGLADLAFYATDDFRLAIGYRFWNGRSIGALGAEWQLPQGILASGTSLFAEGRIGQDGYSSVWGGIRLYLAPQQKSLIRRHREDDPRIRREAEFNDCRGYIREGICYGNVS